MMSLFYSIFFGFAIGWVKNYFDVDIPDFIRGTPFVISLYLFAIFAWKKQIQI